MKNKTKEAPINRLHSILQVLKKDHDDLREMIEVLTSESKSFEKKKEVYEDFSKLLKAHAKTEEAAVYKIAIKIDELKMATYEAMEEHDVADLLMNKIAITKDKDQWLGRVKFLGEAVEHHIIEEETHFLKDLKKQLEMEDEKKMIQEFLTLRISRPLKPSDAHAGILKML